VDPIEKGKKTFCQKRQKYSRDKNGKHGGDILVTPKRLLN
jgi:hypothetical protein